MAKEFYMNPNSGTVQTMEEWEADREDARKSHGYEEGFEESWNLSSLIEVVKNDNGDWVEV